VNPGMKVVLKDNFGNIVDEVDAQQGWPAGDNETKRTMERIAGSDPAMWQTSEKAGGTPKAKNSMGFEDVSFKEYIFLASKKDLPRSLYKESMDIFSSSFPLALVLALGSAVGVLGLRRYLARQS